MNLPQVTEINGIRVLTTQQVSDMYGTNRQTISYNFNYNKPKFTEGKHYIVLSGQALRDFKGCHENLDNLKYAHIAYLWTEKGALLHAKSVNTDKAWEAYEYLVDFYFRVKEQPVVKETKPEPIKKPSGREVVDIPENVKIQEAIKEAEDYITALSVALKEYNAYRSKKSYEDYYMMLNNLSVTTTRKLLDLLELKPNMVIKAGY
ncbi:MAG: ORF6N domain-containing protein [Bacillota bacterium]|nr:ORF6N domain-containing protein [Bacillota bacterium]